MHLEEYFKVKVLEEHKLIYSKILGSVTHEKYQAAMLHAVSLINEHKLVNWLLDATASSITLQDQRWSVETLGLMVRDNSLEKVALVHRDDLFMELAAESMRLRIYEMYGQTKDLEHFDSLEKALKWLVPELSVAVVLPHA